MALEAVVLDERTLGRGSDAQRIEWETNAREFLERASSSIQESARLRVTMAERETLLAFETLDDAPLVAVTIDHELLADLVTDYLDIVRQITTADSLNQMEALDMAKKVTHDRAGRVLKRELRELGFDLETCRRLFTLLLSLRVDTTRLSGLRAHRRAR